MWAEMLLLTHGLSEIYIMLIHPSISAPQYGCLTEANLPRDIFKWSRIKIMKYYTNLQMVSLEICHILPQSRKECNLHTYLVLICGAKFASVLFRLHFAYLFMILFIAHDAGAVNAYNVNDADAPVKLPVSLPVL